jgi:hypothetical protein
LRSLVLAVLALALLASAWANPLASTAVRYNQQAAAAALSIYATLRTVSAALSVLKDADVEGSVLFGSVAASPGQVLEPVTHTIERFSDIMFVVALVSGLLALLLGPAASAGGVVAAAGLAAVVLAASGRPGVPPWLGALGRAAVALGVVLAVVLPTLYGLAFTIGDGLTRAATAEAVAVLERLSARTPELPDAAGEATLLDRFGDLLRGDGVARFMATADELLRATVDLTLAYVLKLVVLPVVLALALWWLARAAPSIVPGR